MLKSYEVLPLIIGISIAILLFILLWVLPFASTEQYYIGEYNQSNLKIAYETCSDKLVGFDGGCNHISVYCKKFWYPIHAFNYCYDGRLEYKWRS